MINNYKIFSGDGITTSNLAGGHSMATLSCAIADDNNNLPMVGTCPDCNGFLVDYEQAKDVDVDGQVVAKEMIVNTALWADFVFEKNYKLATLEEVEIQINENKHLKGIPTNDEVIKSGVNVGEIQAKLLQKVEELTLYLIAQQKKIKELENIIKNK